VLPVPSLETSFPVIKIKEIFNLIKNRTSMGDALMISLAKKHLPFVSTMATWDDRHFKNIFSGTVLTPKKLLKKYKDSIHCFS
jgi:hypothetical protein